MKADPKARQTRCLRVLPQPRGGWILVAEGHNLSEHTTATGAVSAAVAQLREGDELVVVDRYHRCHRYLRRAQTGAPIRPHAG